MSDELELLTRYVDAIVARVRRAEMERDAAIKVAEAAVEGRRRAIVEFEEERDRVEQLTDRVAELERDMKDYLEEEAMREGEGKG